MVELNELLLPIALAAGAVFIASVLSWMLLPFHRKDWPGLPDEQGMISEFRRQNLAPGQYAFPWVGDARETQTLEYKRLLHDGPSGFVIIATSPVGGMTRSLVSWFLYATSISIGAAYIAGRTIPPGADYLTVVRVAGTFASFAYAAALAQGAIWWGRKWSTVSREMFDGLIYGVLTGAVFGTFWPQ